MRVFLLVIAILCLLSAWLLRQYTKFQVLLSRYIQIKHLSERLSLFKSAMKLILFNIPEIPFFRKMYYIKGLFLGCILDFYLFYIDYIRCEKVPLTYRGRMCGTKKVVVTKDKMKYTDSVNKVYSVVLLNEEKDGVLNGKESR